MGGEKKLTFSNVVRAMLGNHFIDRLKIAARILNFRWLTLERAEPP
ncbi:hypothetical protein XFF6166_580004 [Xanthomonas citri pv. fuscans]|nr:hypothetical protein XFF6166_580004 [Xanthomonas citri pv. fuscans]SOO03231.1 hypothetical protein XFF6960_810003 [Xanthomonas citri pv. fuscans]SOO05889.1 hypothetical protein XFF7767_500003 [Xanthomonas citri pv. fuscans]SOO10320.1 hypothetical protein XFF6970_530004 [Xanthomonas citri pv. fuscans]SOO16542.1 hypothetical protein XFF7766_800004 [Xanthomonas citri pv. fuscans]